MSIIRKLASILVINLAVLFITLSFMAWVFDATLLNATQLTASFDKHGVAKAISNALPHMAVPDKGNGPDGQPIEPQDPAEKQKAEDTIRQVADEQYIRTKTNGFLTNVISYIKTGQPKPTLDLTDFAGRVQAATGETPDFAKDLSKPVDITEQTDKKAFENIRKSYTLLKAFKIIGPIIAGVLLIIEIFLTPAGKRLGKLAWVFIAAGLWGMFWWFVVSYAPNFISTKVAADNETEKALLAVVDSLIHSLSSLLAVNFLRFGIACLGIGVSFLLIRIIYRKFSGPSGSVSPAVSKQPPVTK